MDILKPLPRVALPALDCNPERHFRLGVDILTPRCYVLNRRAHSYNVNRSQNGVGVPLLAILPIALVALPACIMPGQTPAIGNAGEAIASCGRRG